MKTNYKYENQKQFWEYAGTIGYGKAIFANPTVERHIIEKQWRLAIETAKEIGVDDGARVLELGCGDGEFANNVLTRIYKSIDAYDVAASAIDSAKTHDKSGKVNFVVRDVTDISYAKGDSWDCAFLIGFLHHVKGFTPKIVERLAEVCPKVVVLDPNGDNLIRKFLELTPSYRRAGEDSFKLKKLIKIFEDNGYKTTIVKRTTLVPSMLPERFFGFVKWIERIVEANRVLSRLCSSYVIGFER
ncbi:MAG: class I SAM-dependent methyltransferase [Deltaproteobacteria bacterium]|nr:class I SAM-dependent methyltransferase [Deltaproteobacteria bacterium]